MGFLIPCPNCGQRDVYEFKYGGEDKKTPAAGADLREWRHYIHFSANVAGVQKEWWFHFGCEEWLLTERDTTTNQILSVEPMDKTGGGS